MTMMMYGMPWFGTLDEAGLAKMAETNFGDKGQEILAAYRRERPTASPTDIACSFVTDRVMWAGSARWAERRSEAAGAAPGYIYRFDFAQPVPDGRLGDAPGGDNPFAIAKYTPSSLAGDPQETTSLATI